MLVRLDEDAATDPETVGAKAVGLARAHAAGLPVLPGYVLPVAASAAAMRTGRAALAERGVARRAVAGTELDGALVAELRTAVTRLGGRVIARSSSPLEGDSRWSGAFSSLTEVGPADIAAAVRGCWASAFAPDPLARLAECGLPLDALRLAVLIQPELRPVAGGTARNTPDGVRITAVRGHPGALLAGWVDGVTALVGSADQTDETDETELSALLGAETVASVAELAGDTHAALGHDVLEWAAAPDVHLLQSGRSAAGHATPPPPGEAGFPVEARVPGTRCAPGGAIGRLVYVRPHETVERVTRRHILACDRPLPAFAPLLFRAGAVVTAGGGADSHLAGVARAVGVPMLVGAPLARITGPLPTINTAPGWSAAIDADRGELAVRRGSSP